MRTDGLRARLSSRPARVGLVVGLLTVSGVAVGLPWDVDMADSQAVKAFEREMKATPEGSIAQPNLLTPRTQRWEPSRLSPDAASVHHDREVDAAMLTEGAALYKTYCVPCHGDGKALGPVASRGLPGVVPLFGTASGLSMQPDGYIFLTVKHGGAIMPSYGWAMSDDEIWSVVEWVRTQPKAARAGG